MRERPISYEGVTLHVTAPPISVCEEDVGFVREQDTGPQVGVAERVSQRLVDRAGRESQVATGDGEKRLAVLYSDRLGRRKALRCEYMRPGAMAGLDKRVPGLAPQRRLVGSSRQRLHGRLRISSSCGCQRPSGEPQTAAYHDPCLLEVPLVEPSTDRRWDPLQGLGHSSRGVNTA